MQQADGTSGPGKSMMAEAIQDLPLPQRLALSYCTAAARDRTLALLALDARLAGIVSQKRETILAQIRLAWWRDRLKENVGQWPAGDAVLAALESWADPAPLAGLVDGWELLLDEDLTQPAIAGFVAGRAAAFTALATELGHGIHASAAGRHATIWASADLAANLGDGDERDMVLRHRSADMNRPRLPRALRPLTVLSGLAARSLAMGGAPLLDGATSGLLAMRLGIFGR